MFLYKRVICLGRKFMFREKTGFHALQNPNQTEVFGLRGKFKTKTKLTYHILCPFFVSEQLMKAKVCSFHKIISKLLWQSSGNGSCSFLYQLSDLYLASLQKQSLSSQLVWSGRFWIRSVPLKGLMFPVLSHGFIHSHEGKGEPCWAALEPC